MRFLIVATAILACAAAVPSGLLPVPYTAPLAVAPVAVAPVARLAPAQPTISAGDINGAALEARAEASDHLRAAVDANRQLNDKVSEINGQAINNAEENAWRAVDAVKTAEAQLDGAAAGAAPAIAKSIVRSSVVAPVPYAAPAVAVAAPAVAVAAPAVPYAAPAVSYAAPAVPYADTAVAYSAPAVSYAAPAVSYAAPAVSYAAPVGYAAAPDVYSAPLSYNAPLNYGYEW